MGGQDRDFNGEAGSRTKDGRVQFWKCMFFEKIICSFMPLSLLT